MTDDTNVDDNRLFKIEMIRLGDDDNKSEHIELTRLDSQLFSISVGKFERFDSSDRQSIIVDSDILIAFIKAHQGKETSLLSRITTIRFGGELIEGKLEISHISGTAADSGFFVISVGKFGNPNDCESVCMGCNIDILLAFLEAHKNTGGKQ